MGGNTSSPTVVATDPRSMEQRDFQNWIMSLMRAGASQKRMPTFGQAMPSIFQQIYGMGTMPGMIYGMGTMPDMPPMPPNNGLPPGAPPFMGPPPRPSAGVPMISSGSRMIRSGSGSTMPNFGSMGYR